MFRSDPKPTRTDDAPTPLRTATSLVPVEEAPIDNSLKWFALLVREGLMVIVSGVERHYGLRRRVESRFDCPRCGWRG
jgi:hypothetical protein